MTILPGDLVRSGAGGFGSLYRSIHEGGWLNVEGSASAPAGATILVVGVDEPDPRGCALLRLLWDGRLWLAWADMWVLA